MKDYEDRNEHLMTNVDIIVLENGGKKAYLPDGYTVTWWYVLIGLFGRLKPKERELFCFLAANVRNGNIVRMSKTRMMNEIGCPLNHLNSKLKKLRECEAIRELQGIGYQISPHLVWCGKRKDYPKVLYAWEKEHGREKNIEMQSERGKV